MRLGVGDGFPGLGPKPTIYFKKRVGMKLLRLSQFVATKIATAFTSDNIGKTLEQEIVSELEWLKGLLEVAEDSVTRKNIHARAQLLLYKLEDIALKEVA